MTTTKIQILRDALTEARNYCSDFYANAKVRGAEAAHKRAFTVSQIADEALRLTEGAQDAPEMHPKQESAYKSLVSSLRCQLIEAQKRGEHYRATAPEFELLDDTYGVMSQIDNMLTGLTRKPAPGCTRSHPHEDMDAACKAKTVRARADFKQATAEHAKRAEGEQAPSTIHSPGFRARVARMRPMATPRGKEDYRALVAAIDAWARRD